MYRNNNFQIKNSSRTLRSISFLQKGSTQLKKRFRSVCVLANYNQFMPGLFSIYKCGLRKDFNSSSYLIKLIEIWKELLMINTTYLVYLYP